MLPVPVTLEFAVPGYETVALRAPAFVIEPVNVPFVPELLSWVLPVICPFVSMVTLVVPESGIDGAFQVPTHVPAKGLGVDDPPLPPQPAELSQMHPTRPKIVLILIIPRATTAPGSI